MKLIKQSNENYREQIRKKVIEHNMSQLSDEIKSPLENICFIIKNNDGELVGGVTATTFWYHMHIDFLWVSEAYREHGYGGKLMKELEAVAVEKKCRLILLDTFSFQAPEFYKKHGFSIIGVVEDHPVGHSQYFMEKRL